MQPLTDTQKKKLNAAIDEVCDCVSNGEQPDTAIVKVAQKQKLTEDYLPILVRSYNNGAASAHRTASTTIQEKAASYPVANIDSVKQLIYGTPTVKQASTTIRPPDLLEAIPAKVWFPEKPSPFTPYTRQKQASARQHEREVPLERGVIDAVTHVNNSARMDTTKAKEQLKEAQYSLQEYLTRSGIPRKELLQQTAEAKYGKQAIKEAGVFNSTNTGTTRIKSSSYTVTSPDPVMTNDHPFVKLLDKVMNCESNYKKALAKEASYLTESAKALAPLSEKQAKQQDAAEVSKLFKDGQAYWSKKKIQ